MFVSSFLNWNLTQNKTLARREPIYNYSLNVYRKIQEKNSELVDEKKWIKQQKKKKINNQDKKTFMRIQFVSQIYVYRRK